MAEGKGRALMPPSSQIPSFFKMGGAQSISFPKRWMSTYNRFFDFSTLFGPCQLSHARSHDFPHRHAICTIFFIRTPFGLDTFDDAHTLKYTLEYRTTSSQDRVTLVANVWSNLSFVT